MRSARPGTSLCWPPTRTRSERAHRPEALVVDLTFDVPERIELVRSARPPGLKTLAFYSHVEADVRDQGREAGFDLVVPRSRMAREGVAVLDRLMAGSGDADPAP